VNTGPQRRILLAAGLAALAGWSSRAQVQSALVDAIARLKPSVLPVGTFNPTDNPRFTFRGTGFVVGDGLTVATNFHVLPPATDPDALANLVVRTGRAGESGEFRRVRVLGSDRARDLSLLRLEGQPLAPVVLDEAGQAREGQAVALMGFPIGSVLGFAPVTHRGIIASITTAALPAATAQQLDPRALLRLREGNFELFQLDATAYPGNSGGPVFDAETGRVLAVVNMVLVKAGRESALTNPTGISYAIPVRHLRDLMRDLQPR
jgi:serine protease Do